MFVAVFALGMLASASASAALPEFSLRVRETFPVSYSGTGGSAFWESSGYEFTCTTTTMTGTIAGAKTVTGTTLIFNGCKVEGKKCRSEGSENNEQIRAEHLAGTLVYLSKTAKTVGIDFKPETGEFFTHLTCFGGGSKVRGSVIMAITSVNTLANHFTLTVHRGSTSYENEAGEAKTAKLEAEALGGPVWGPLSWEFVSSIATSKSLEVKA